MAKPMRTTLPALAAAVTSVLVAFAPGAARADDANVPGTYEVKFDEVSNNCTQTSTNLARGTVEVGTKKGGVTVDIERIPSMSGAAPKAGKIKAQSKLGPSNIEGLDGKFSVAGKADDGVIQLVFVAEYYLKGKPFCTQSWNVSGLKKTELDKK